MLRAHVCCSTFVIDTVNYYTINMIWLNPEKGKKEILIISFVSVNFSIDIGSHEGRLFTLSYNTVSR